MGIDPMVDTWIKKGAQARAIVQDTYSILTGVVGPTAHVNRARAMLLSKEPGDPTPPINRIRPIQMYSPFRKALEVAIDYVDRDAIWGTIHPSQQGSRPKSAMYQQTLEYYAKVHSREFDYALFIDFTEAFNRVHQPLLVDELTRRYKAWERAVAQIITENGSGH